VKRINEKRKFSRKIEDMSVMEKANYALQLKEEWNIEPYNSGAKKTIKDIAETLYEHERTIYRLIKLTNLTPEFQELVDEGKIGLVKAYHISKLDQEKQEELLKENEDLIVRKNRSHLEKLIREVSV